MSKYSNFKYLVIIIAMVIGFIYTIPNFYGQAPSVQITSTETGKPLEVSILPQIETLLNQNNFPVTNQVFDSKSLTLKFKDLDTQIKARDLIQNFLGNNYIVALNLVSNSPKAFAKINANPMFLGLDLRGGVHFLLTVDIKAALKKILNKHLADIKRELKANHLYYTNTQLLSSSAVISFSDLDTLNSAYQLLTKNLPNIKLVKNPANNELSLIISDDEFQKIKSSAMKQNMLTLHNRINELGVSEPIIQQEGSDRIMVELPGIQDTAHAKNILGRTANLEVRLVDDDPSNLSSALSGHIPPQEELLEDISSGTPVKILVYKEVQLTGDNITNAEPGFDQNGMPAVNLQFDNSGALIFKQVTTDNIGKRLAMVLVDSNRSQVITAPSINQAIGGGTAQITGHMTLPQANDVALLLRSGSLAAPMTIIEERTIGPSLGKENIKRGLHSVIWGFSAIAIFMIIYYSAFGLISVLSLAVNLLLLVALLSMLQATLTLPGIAAIALTLGMAIDSNVLINERIREERRSGQSTLNAIEAGYKHAWATILDSNITTLIAGLALLAFGFGAVKGFAVVHCLGILTSMFSAVLVSRGIVAILYTKFKLKKIYI